MTILRAHRFGLGVWADLVALHRSTGTDVVVVHHAELPVDLAHLVSHATTGSSPPTPVSRALHPPARASPTLPLPQRPPWTSPRPSVCIWSTRTPWRVGEWIPSLWEILRAVSPLRRPASLS
ncbi:hypothetical protein [Streptomyces sp. NPDC060035]|uniref:hypothetical protein n=1 Tax=Streptomyces sp. NPDC060035 TaxID=3347044 RepID=UPI0036A5AE66